MSKVVRLPERRFAAGGRPVAAVQRLPINGRASQSGRLVLSTRWTHSGEETPAMIVRSKTATNG